MFTVFELMFETFFYIFWNQYRYNLRKHHIKRYLLLLDQRLEPLFSPQSIRNLPSFLSIWKWTQQQERYIVAINFQHFSPINCYSCIKWRPLACAFNLDFATLSLSFIEHNIIIDKKLLVYSHLFQLSFRNTQVSTTTRLSFFLIHTNV